MMLCAIEIDDRVMIAANAPSRPLSFDKTRRLFSLITVLLLRMMMFGSGGGCSDRMVDRDSGDQAAREVGVTQLRGSHLVLPYLEWCETLKHHKTIRRVGEGKNQTCANLWMSEAGRKERINSLLRGKTFP
jgi:hypothetical protein